MNKYNQSTEKRIRFTLGLLLLIMALNAFGGGYYGMTGAKDIPVKWLQDSPFQNYFIPGLFLFTCIGGLSFYSSICVFRRNHKASKTVFICGLLILIWLTIQMSIISFVSWIQPVTACVVVIIFYLNYKLSNYGH